MKRKATISLVQLILVIAICIVGLILILSLFNSAYGEGCKRAQMEELSKIWRELRYWEAREGITSPVSFNTIPDFHVKPCVYGITFEKEGEEGNITIEWKDGSKEVKPAKGEWLLCEPLPPNEEGYDVRVSLRRVEIFYKSGKAFCPYCKCNEAGDDCNRSEDVFPCIGCVKCDHGICVDSDFNEEDPEWGLYPCCSSDDCPDHACIWTTCYYGTKTCDDDWCNWADSVLPCGDTWDECEINCRVGGCALPSCECKDTCDYGEECCKAEDCSGCVICDYGYHGVCEGGETYWVPGNWIDEPRFHYQNHVPCCVDEDCPDYYCWTVDYAQWTCYSPRIDASYDCEPKSCTPVDGPNPKNCFIPVLPGLGTYDDQNTCIDCCECWYEALCEGGPSCPDECF